MCAGASFPVSTADESFEPTSEGVTPPGDTGDPPLGDGSEETGSDMTTTSESSYGAQDITVLEGLIEYIGKHNGVWFATHEQVARYCHETADAGPVD